MTVEAVLDQRAVPVRLRWNVGDLVNLQLRVLETDWSGTYSATLTRGVTNVSMTVSAVFDGTDTTFQFSLSDVESDAVAAGLWEFVCVQSTGLTRFAGYAEVE